MLKFKEYLREFATGGGPKGPRGRGMGPGGEPGRKPMPREDAIELAKKHWKNLTNNNSPHVSDAGDVVLVTWPSEHPNYNHPKHGHEVSVNVLGDGTNGHTDYQFIHGEPPTDKYGTRNQTELHYSPALNNFVKPWRPNNILKEFLDVKTHSVAKIAKKHGVSIEHIQHQLSMGIKVEGEHTTHKDKAREIALDHLWENPNYYTKLRKMEKKK
jgi:hypothetical protein